MDEKWRLPLWAAAATKDMEFAVTQRSASPFVEEVFVFFDKLLPPAGITGRRLSFILFTLKIFGVHQWQLKYIIAVLSVSTTSQLPA